MFVCGYNLWSVHGLINLHIAAQIKSVSEREGEMERFP